MNRPATDALRLAVSQTEQDDFLERVVELLKTLYYNYLWEESEDALLGFLIDVGAQVGELLEEHRRAQIVGCRS